METDTASEPAILVRGLTLERGRTTVLDGLDLTVAGGEVHALLGGNGAGKSSLLHVLLGLLRPAAGTAQVCGHDPAREPDEVRARVAYVPENVALYEHLSARENVRYFLDLARVQCSAATMDAAFDDVGLAEDARSRPIGAHSKGMRQKTAIALALLRGAPVLLLDEPTTGLDPLAVSDFHGLLTVARGRGIAVLMVTHDLLGAVDVADRIGVLHKGRVTARHAAEVAGRDRFDLRELHRALGGMQDRP